MRIRIPIPRRVIVAYDRFEDWMNERTFTMPLVQVDVLRIDILLAVLFLFCVGWYFAFGGWLAAIQGALAFLFIMMCALWVWRR